jgi:hypothetical protein
MTSPGTVNSAGLDFRVGVFIKNTDIHATWPDVGIPPLHRFGFRLTGIWFFLF